MPTRLTPVMYRGWAGGINDFKNLLVLRENELAEARNFYVARDGHIKRRAGQAKVYSSSFTGGAIAHGLFQARLNATNYLLTTAGAVLYQDNGTDITGTAPLTAGANNPVVMIQTNDTVLGDLVIGVQSDTTAGINKPFKWTGTGNATLLEATGNVPTRAVAVIPWKNRLFWGNVTFQGTVYPEYVVWSDDGKVDAYTGQNIAGLNPGSGGFITAFLRLGLGPEPDQDVMLVFKNNALHYLRHQALLGDSVVRSAFRSGDCSFSVGCPAPLGAVEADGVAYWPSYRGFYRMGPELTVTEKNYLGKPIETFWATVPHNRIPHVKGAYLEDLGQIWWAVSAGTSQTTNNRIVVFDVVFQRFVAIYDGILANVMARIIDSNLNRKVYASDYSNMLIYEQNTGLDDDGTGFNAWFKTGYLDLRSPGTMKSFRKALLELGSDTQKLGTVYVYLYNLSSTQAQALDVSTSGVPLGEFLLDTDFLGGSDYSQYVGRLGNRARYAQLEYRTTQQKGFDCYGLGFYVVGRRSGPGVSR